MYSHWKQGLEYHQLLSQFLVLWLIDLSLVLTDKQTHSPVSWRPLTPPNWPAGGQPCPLVTELSPPTSRTTSLVLHGQPGAQCHATAALSPSTSTYTPQPLRIPNEQNFPFWYMSRIWNGCRKFPPLPLTGFPHYPIPIQFLQQRRDFLRTLYIDSPMANQCGGPCC